MRTGDAHNPVEALKRPNYGPHMLRKMYHTPLACALSKSILRPSQTQPIILPKVGKKALRSVNVVHDRLWEFQLRQLFESPGI